MTPFLLLPPLPLVILRYRFVTTCVLLTSVNVTKSVQLVPVVEEIQIRISNAFLELQVEETIMYKHASNEISPPAPTEAAAEEEEEESTTTTIGISQR